MTPDATEQVEEVTRGAWGAQRRRSRSFVLASAVLLIGPLSAVASDGKGASPVAGAAVSSATHLLPPGRFAFRSYGVADGLSNLAIEDMAQDAEGFLWIATQDGLFRFDGERFSRLGEELGLPSVWLTAVAAGPGGRLWVGTRRGLAWRQGERFETASPSALPRSRVNGLSVDAAGTLFVALEDGLFRTLANGGFVPVEGWPSQRATAVAAHPTAPGVLYAADGARVGRRGTDGKWSWWSAAIEPGESIDALAMDRSSRLWASSTRHLFSLGPNERELRDETAGVDRLTNSTDRSFLALDRAGSLWVPSNSGLFQRRNEGWWPLGASQGLPGGWAQGVFHDREGSLWTWQTGVGVHRIRGRGLWESWTTEEGLPGDLVWSVHRSRSGQLWVGTSQGLARAAGGRWETVAGTEDVAVRAIAEAADGTLWLGTAPAYVLQVDPRLGVVRRFGPSEGVGGRKVLDLLVDSSGTVWVGTMGQGLVRKEPAEKRFSSVGGPRETVFVAQDSRGRIWAGGSGGAGLMLRDGERWRHFTTEDGLLNGDVIRFRATADGDVWVGYAEPVGISRLRLVSGALHVVEHRRVAGHSYFLGLDGGGRLWRGTGSGVEVYGAGETRRFDTSDGLVGDDCAYDAFLADSGGDVFVGTSRGLSRFRTADDTVAPIPTRTALVSAMVGGVSLLRDGPPPAFERRRNTFTVRFAGLSFVNESRVEHQVRLVGLESDWVNTRSTEARYPLLSHGSYVFAARSRAGEGPWGPPTRVAFRILPGWWETWIARLAGLTIVAGAVGLVFYLRLRQVERRRMQLERVVVERTAELAVANEELRRLSSLDGLTGLANRRCFDEWLEREWRRADRERSEIGLILLDVDFFKLYNDSYGHPAGDECLRRVARVLAEVVGRPHDLAARYGGEEFAVILPGASPAAVCAIAERIRLAVQGLALPHAASRVAATVSTSLGAASTSPRDGEGCGELVKTADEALYRAKEGGRNRVELHEGHLRSAAA